MTREEANSCIGTIEMLQRLAYNIHGVMDVIDADNCKKIIKALERTRWIPIDEKLPEVDEDGDSDYIFISLENFSLPVIGRYAIDQDGDGSFYEGDEERTLLSYGLFVNAWMPLPKPYRESE